MNNQLDNTANKKAAWKAFATYTVCIFIVFLLFSLLPSDQYAKNSPLQNSAGGNKGNGSGISTGKGTGTGVSTEGTGAENGNETGVGSASGNEITTGKDNNVARLANSATIKHDIKKGTDIYQIQITFEAEKEKDYLKDALFILNSFKFYDGSKIK